MQGQGEVEAGTVERGALGGALTDQSTKGEGRVIWKAATARRTMWQPR